MTKLVDWLSRACATLGLPIEIEFDLDLPGQKQAKTLARISSVGAKNGMLIFETYDKVRACSILLIQEGYGFCVLDEPKDSEEFDLESFREMFIDWGWSDDSLHIDQSV